MERNDEGTNWVKFQGLYKQGFFSVEVKIWSCVAQGRMEDVICLLVSNQERVEMQVSV